MYMFLYSIQEPKQLLVLSRYMVNMAIPLSMDQQTLTIKYVHLYNNHVIYCQIEL